MLIQDIADFLISNAVTTGGWGLFCGYLPDIPDLSISIWNGIGGPPDTLGRENQNLGVMTRVRGTREKYAQAEAKWQQIFDLLQDAQEVPGSPVLLPGVRFIQVETEGPNEFWDDKGRPNLTSNWRVKRDRP